MANNDSNNVHQGHRKRMKERFEKNGFEGFSQHEILEMLLYYTYPRIDTNEIAHSLINRFGSLAGVMDASIDTISEEGGVSYNTALLLKMIPASMKVYYASHFKGEVFDTPEKMKSLMIAAFTGAVSEEFRLVCFDNDMRLIRNTIINRGTPSSSPVDMHKITEEVMAAHSMNIVIAHNHPSGTSEPSANDVFATRRIIEIMGAIGVSVLDHIIVGADGAYSMRGNSALGIFDR